MVTTTTKFVNDTEIPFVLKEGNAGVYTQVCTLAAEAPKNQHNVEIDPNATYREYVVATNVANQKVLVTSDDCAEFSTIRIVKEGNDTYTFKGDKRSETKGPGFFGWLKSWTRNPRSV